MREILFRGKAIDDNWYYGVPLVFTEDYVCMTAPHTYNKAVIPETVGQYTGLTDKNGTKIFEGDIMPVYEQGEEYYYKVVYNGDCFMLAMLDSEQGSYPLSTKNAISEVIGNIHDNPELLKGGE